MLNSTLSPIDWRCRSFTDLIGPAAAVGRVIAAKITRLKAAGTGGAAKHCFYGPPGTGKTELAELVALQLAGDKLGIERISGLKVGVDLVKRWLDNIGTGSLFGDWQVKVVHEMDRIPRDAQDLLLDYLDQLPTKTAFLGTSNMQIDLLQERFQTRMQPWKILGPTQEEVTAFLLQHWDVDPGTAALIAGGCGGCVRAALLDLESHLDVQLAA